MEAGQTQGVFDERCCSQISQNTEIRTSGLILAFLHLSKRLFIRLSESVLLCAFKNSRTSWRIFGSFFCDLHFRDSLQSFHSVSGRQNRERQQQQLQSSGGYPLPAPPQFVFEAYVKDIALKEDTIFYVARQPVMNSDLILTKTFFGGGSDHCQ